MDMSKINKADGKIPPTIRRPAAPWRKVLRTLKEEVSLPFPVRVFIQDDLGHFGEAELRKAKKSGNLYGCITLDASLSDDLSERILIHEYAHLLADTYAGAEDVWTVAFRECYSAIYGQH